MTLDDIRVLIVTTTINAKQEIVDALNKTGITSSVYDTSEKIYKNIINALSISNDFKNTLIELIAKFGFSQNQQPTMQKSQTLGFITQPMYQATLSPDAYGTYPKDFDPSFKTQSWDDASTLTTPPVNASNLNASGQGSLYDLNTRLGIYSDTAQQSASTEAATLSQIQAALSEEKINMSKSWILPSVLTIVAFTAIYHFYIKKK
jgi:hypothetical protein